MGVTGLWRLIEPVGKPVPVETLENKVLAVDISIWLHQVVKGYQDAKGAPLPNAHLMGLFQRLCKLLYFRIKPIFVFDGGFPDLKKETIAKRQDNKSKYNSESERIKRELFLLLSKKTAISTLLGKQTSPKKGNNTTDTSNNDDLFKLPALPEKEEESDSESDDEKDSGAPVLDLHSVDIESEKFKNLPVKEKYDLLVELKETRKMNSWRKLHELPKQSDNFSDFQMQRLLKRRKVQECLEETEKEMGDSGMSLNELESLLNEEGIDTRIENFPTRRVASNESTRFLLINNAKQVLAEAKKKKEAELNTNKIEKEISISDSIKPKKTDELEDDLQKTMKMSLECVTDSDLNTNNSNSNKIEEISINDGSKPQEIDELEDDLQKAIKMSLECVTDSQLNADTSKTDDSWTSLITDSDSSNTDYSNTDSEGDGFDQPDMSSAKAYIMQYTDFTHKAIDTIVTSKRNDKCKSKDSKVDKVLEELKHEKSIIIDNVDLTSENESVENASDSNNIIIANQNQNEDHVNTTVNLETPIKDDSLNKTLSSVILIENPIHDVISLDSSTEENVKQIEIKSEFNKSCDKDIEEKSDSSDDDFEEVPETDNKKINEHVVELTLNMGQAVEDDIFADVFEKKEKSETYDIKIDSTHINHSENILKNKSSEIVTEHITREHEDNDKIINENEEHAIAKDKLVAINENTDIVADKSLEKSIQVDLGNKLNTSSKEHISSEELNSIVEEVQKEEQELLQEKGRLDRIGRNITEQMTKEAQELLRIFGIPYIVAPMEAEAQCAFLESIKLTDGTITDDSDIWLFGGKTVYKNFFNHRKHVLQFLSERIENSFNLTREQLILLALLVGSDYTTGVTGVGPVTALEILASFPFNKKQLLNETSKQARYAKIVSGLQEFKQWVWAGKRTDNTSLKKKLKNVTLMDDFPSIRVLQAYLEPNVEKSEDKFTWGQLDITILRDYTKTRFGWSQNKLDEIIKPVLKRMLERKSQKTVHDYFNRKVQFHSLEEQMSKRVKAAVKRMGPEAPLEKESNTEGEETKPKPPKKRKTTKKKTVDNDHFPENNFSDLIQKAGPSGTKKIKQREKNILIDNHIVKVTQMEEAQSGIEINIPKSDRFQEIIPQREKDKQDIMQNKLKAIEIFRKTKIDRKKKPFKKTPILPKEKAELSESSDSN